MLVVLCFILYMVFRIIFPYIDPLNDIDFKRKEREEAYRNAVLEREKKLRLLNPPKFNKKYPHL